MGCAPSRIHERSDGAVRRREEIMAQARRQRVRESKQLMRKEWDRQKLYRRMENIHKADGVPDGWGIPDLGYAETCDRPHERYPWSV